MIFCFIISQRLMATTIKTSELGKIAKGLNIEGYRPTLSLPEGCKWYNIIQVIDEPLKGVNFNDVMGIVYEHKHNFIEEAVGIDIEEFVNTLVDIINGIKTEHKKLLVHVHQYKGTTILDKVLHERTGVDVILDETNFFDSPIVYKDKYPDIDGLLSISQCAGLDTPAGAWIIPSGFMEFDVTHNIIFSNRIAPENGIKDYIPSTLQYIDGDILFVNDLWNPVKGTNPKIIILDSIGAQVLQFVVKSTRPFDESHNWKHAIQVAHNALDIIDSKEALYLALLHDVCDHKYSESIPREELSRFIARNIPEFGHIDSLIDHVSFSSQKTMDKVHPVLEAVRDGDRLEAIGEIGLIRCAQVTISRGGKDPEDVIKHCFDKLLRLVPEEYIANRTTEAVRRHNVIVDYLKQHGYDVERLDD